MATAKNRTNRIGILGGGQLALMLGDAARRLGFTPIVLAENSSAPAAQAFPDAIYGSVSDIEALRTLFSQVEKVIFENEFVDCEKIKIAAEPWAIQFIPGLEAISRFQDKILQKQLLEQLQIPTAPYMILKNGGTLGDSIQELKTIFKTGCVLKWARMGYDGKGVLRVDLSQNLTPAILARADAFIAEAKRQGSPVFAEQEIRFKRELALISAYSTKEEFKPYPLVVSEQSEGICSLVYGPATALGVSTAVERDAHSYALKLAETARLYGVFAIEFFETQEGGLIVNEIAPRVHNSGHYTQNAGVTDQFENHIRASLDYPLGPTVPQVGAFGMLNILGPSTQDINQKTEPSIGVSMPVPGPRSHLHWYGKKEIRARRKLGHLNGTVENIQDLQSLVNELKGCYEDWIKKGNVKS